MLRTVKDLQRCSIRRLSAALGERFSPCGQAGFADQVLPATRYQFGGYLGKGRKEGISSKRDAS